MRRSNGRFLWLAAAGLALTSGASAQAPVQGELATIAAQVGARHQVQLLVDPELRAPRGLRSPPPGLSLERSLDTLRGRLSNAAWRRIRLPESTAAASDAARLAAIIRVLDRIEPGHLVVELPERAEVIRFARVPGPAGVPPPPAAGTSEVFILYSTASTSDGRSPEARVAELERQQLALESADEHLPVGVGQLLQLMQTLPPAQMERLAGPTVLASYRIWDATPPEQRQSMMQQTVEVMQPLLNPEPGRQGAAAGGAAPPAVAVNRLPELSRIARGLEKKNQARILLAPDLFIAARPVPPDAALTLPQALSKLVRPHTGVQWRKLQAPESLGRKLEARQTAATLAVAVRALQDLEYAEIAILDANSGTVSSYCRQPARKATEAPEGAPQLMTAPLHLVFDASPAASGRTPAERLLSIQGQQFREMFRMSPDQLARSMESSMRSYRTADPATQKRLLALPMMSGMMAGWFPRQAKENGLR